MHSTPLLTDSISSEPDLEADDSIADRNCSINPPCTAGDGSHIKPYSSLFLDNIHKAQVAIQEQVDRLDR